MWWLWLLLIVLVGLIVAMEFFQARMLKRLGARTPPSVVVLRIVNIVLLAAALIFAAWFVALKGR